MSEHHYSQESREFLRENLQQFLAAINNCTEEEAMLLPLTWQIFPESPLLRSMDFLDAKILHGTPRKYWPTLLDRNEDGYHIGLCTSRMRPSITGKPRRDKESVESFHYLAVDIDVKDRDQEVHPEAPDYGDALTTFGLGLAPLSPTILVSSGHGFHLYYALETPQNVGNWPSVLRARLGLWQHFEDWGADKTLAMDSTKCLRLPGTYNLKYDPKPCRIMMVCKKTYKLEDLIAAYPYKEKIKVQNHKPTGVAYKPTLPAKTRVRMAYDWLVEQEPAVQGDFGSDDCMRAAWVGPRFALRYDIALELLEKFYNPLCSPEWSENELMHKLDDAYESATHLKLIGCGMPDFQAQRDNAFLKANMDLFDEGNDAD
jgi:hypothetical protein